MEGIDTIYGFLNYIYNNQKSVKESEINLIYEGIISHRITKTFASITEEKMEKDDESDPVQRKVFHVMVECLQNISKHANNSKSFNESQKRGIVMVAKSIGKYSIVTGNHIENQKIPELKAVLDNLNILTKEELNLLFKTKLKNNVLSDKGGAGLGFIDIARKTGEKLIFDFVPINETFSYFILLTTVVRN